MEVVQWEAQEPGVPQPRMKASGEWTEAKTKGKKYKAGKGGKAVTTVRDLKPRPCHTFVLAGYVALTASCSGITSVHGAVSRAVNVAMPTITVRLLVRQSYGS